MCLEGPAEKNIERKEGLDWKLFGCFFFFMLIAFELCVPSTCDVRRTTAVPLNPVFGVSVNLNLNSRLVRGNLVESFFTFCSAWRREQANGCYLKNTFSFSARKGRWWITQAQSALQLLCSMDLIRLMSIRKSYFGGVSALILAFYHSLYDWVVCLTTQYIHIHIFMYMYISHIYVHVCFFCFFYDVYTITDGSGGEAPPPPPLCRGCRSISPCILRHHTHHSVQMSREDKCLLLL